MKTQDTTIKIDQKDSKAWNNEGLYLSKLGKYDNAIKSYNKAIELICRIHWLGSIKELL